MLQQIFITFAQIKIDAIVPTFTHKCDDEFICNAINAYMKRAYFGIANQIMSLMCGKWPFYLLVFIKYGGTEWFTMKTNDSFPIRGTLQRFFYNLV